MQCTSVVPTIKLKMFLNILIFFYIIWLKWFRFNLVDKLNSQENAIWVYVVRTHKAVLLTHNNDFCQYNHVNIYLHESANKWTNEIYYFFLSKVFICYQIMSKPSQTIWFYLSFMSMIPYQHRWVGKLPSSDSFVFLECLMLGGVKCKIYDIKTVLKV